MVEHSTEIKFSPEQVNAAVDVVKKIITDNSAHHEARHEVGEESDADGSLLKADVLKIKEQEGVYYLRYLTILKQIKGILGVLESDPTQALDDAKKINAEILTYGAEIIKKANEPGYNNGFLQWVSNRLGTLSTDLGSVIKFYSKGGVEEEVTNLQEEIDNNLQEQLL